MPAAGRTRITTTIDTSGPFFTKDPAKTFRANIRELMDALALEGAADVIAQLLSNQSRRAPIRIVEPPRVAGHVVGRTQNLRGKRWQATAVISVLNVDLTKAEGTALMAAAAEIESRDHVFRRTTSRLRRARAINRAELLKGLQ